MESVQLYIELERNLLDPEVLANRRLGPLLDARVVRTS